MSNIGIYIVVGALGLLTLAGLVALIWLIVGLLYKNRTFVKIINRDGSVTSKMYKHLTDSKVKIDGKTYYIDDECFVRTIWGKQLYYYNNIPYPIKFDFKAQNIDIRSSSDARVKISAEDLTALMESDLIQKLFASKGLLQAAVILLIVNILISIAILIIMFTQAPDPCILSNYPNNTQFIADAVKIAIGQGVA